MLLQHDNCYVIRFPNRPLPDNKALSRLFRNLAYSEKQEDIQLRLQEPIQNTARLLHALMRIQKLFWENYKLTAIFPSCLVRYPTYIL